MKKMMKVLFALLLMVSCFTLPTSVKAASDLAFNKEVTTSSVEAALPNNVGNLVTDGDINTRWSTSGMKTSSTTDSDTQVAQWLIIDLGVEEASVSNIEISFFKKVWATKYRVETAADLNAESWEELASKEKVSDSTTSDPTDTLEINKNVKRYVRFYFEKINVTAGGTGVSVTDINIYGDVVSELPLQTTNIALSKVITTTGNSESLVNLNDGNDATTYTTQVNAGSSVEFVMDLMAETNIITALGMNLNGTYEGLTYTIETSSDNIAFTNVVGGYLTESIDVEYEVTLQRYVRLTIHSTVENTLEINEVTLQGVQENIVEPEFDTDFKYETDFSEGIDGWEVLYGSNASLTSENGAMKIAYGSSRAGVVYKDMEPVTNVLFEADVTPAQDGVRFGIILRATNEQNKVYIGCENSNNKWFWEYWNNGANTWSSMTTASPMQANKTYNMKVKLLGDKVTLTINNQEIFSQTMTGTPLLNAGYVGFDKSNSAGTFTIDNVKITKLADSASDMLNKIVSIPTITADDSVVPLPEVKEGYELKVVGSDSEYVIDNDGNVSPFRVEDQKVTLILQLTNLNDPSDVAKKNIEVYVEKTFMSNHVENEKPLTLPMIQEWTGGFGVWSRREDSKIIYADEEAKEIAQMMKDDLIEICDQEFEVVQGTKEDVRLNDIFLELVNEDDKWLKEEGYYIKIDGSGIFIEAKELTGLLYGTVTIEQILYLDKTREYVPCGYIRDYPNYEIRGVMFDVGRIPHRIQYLQDYTNILKWYKMSEFHLHLNDDFTYSPTASGANFNSWTGMHRLESDVFPSLADKQVYNGSQFAYFNEEYADPTYSKEEYRELEALAKSKGIDLLAEFDTPSHSTAYIEYAKANPDGIEWLGEIQTGTNREMLAIDVNSSDAGEKQRALNARKFIEELYKDYLGGDNPTITNDTVHVGADEYWDKSQNEAFRDYTNFLGNLMKSYGKTARIWGAQKMFPGNTYIDPSNFVIDFWATYEEDPLARLAEGYRLVNVPQTALYNTPDRDHKDMIGEEYLFKNWSVNIFDVTNNTAAMKGEPLLLGAKTALWGDEHKEGTLEADTHERMLRAIAMVSYKTWSDSDEISYFEYQQMFEKLAEGPNTNIAYEVEDQDGLVVDYSGMIIQDDTLLDISGNGYDATLTNINTKEIDGETYLEFNGQSLMTTPIETIGYPYTVSFDVQTTSGNDETSRLFDGYDGRLNADLSINRSFYTQSFGYEIPSDEVVNVKIVGTWLNTKLYVNDVLVKMLYSSDTGVATEYFTTFVFPFKEIGENFHGYIGNIKVFNKAFTSEIIHNDPTKVTEINVALNAEAYAERFGANPALNSGDLKRHPSFKAVDGDKVDSTVNFLSSDPNSYWLSSNHNDDHIIVDLKEPKEINKVVVNWNSGQHAKAFKVLVGNAFDDLKEVANITNNTNTINTIEFEKETVQYVMIQGVTRSANYYGVREIEVYQTVNKADLKERIEKAKTMNVDPLLIAQAIAVLENPLASQQAVNKIESDLNFEIIKLDDSELQKLLNKIGEMSPKEYTALSFDPLFELFLEAQKDYSIQDEIDQMVADLNMLISKLVKLEAMNFEDVQDEKAWFYGSVEKAYQIGLMGATGKKDANKPEAKFFEPDAPITRGMVATVLYRMAGQPKVEFDATFKDVTDASLWYSTAITWAASANVVSGYKDGRFGPDDNITRQDLAIMLRNYAKAAGLDTNKQADLTSFLDDDKVDGYATSAVAWCVEAKLMSGQKTADGNLLNPKNNASRAECAKMFALLYESIQKNN